MLLNQFFEILSLESEGTNLTAVIRLNPDHEIYKAHFPGQPITPGVCQIQMVTEILTRHLGVAVELTDIKSVKYMSVISPIEVTELVVVFQKIAFDSEICKVIVNFVKDEQTFSKLSMTYHVVHHHSNL